MGYPFLSSLSERLNPASLRRCTDGGFPDLRLTFFIPCLITHMTNNAQRDTDTTGAKSDRDQGQQQGNKSQSQQNFTRQGAAVDHNGLGSSGASYGSEKNRGDGNNISSGTE